MNSRLNIDLNRVIEKIQSGAISEADKLVTDLLKKNPENVSLLEIASIVKIQSGNLKEAEFILKRILHLDNQNLSAKFNLCKVLEDQHFFKEAEELFLTLCSKNPTNQVYLAYFNLLIKTNSFQKIISEWEGRFNSQSEDPAIINTVGVAYSKEKNFSKAEEIFHRGCQLDSNSFQIWNNLGQLYIKLCNFSAAKQCLEKSISLNNSFYESWNNYGVVIEKTGDLKNAIQIYKRALNLSPHSEECINNLASAYLQEKDYHGAFNLLENYLKRQEPKFLNGLYLFCSMFTCYWDNYKEKNDRLCEAISLKNHSIVSPFHALSLVSDAHLQKIAIEKWVNENLFFYPETSLIPIKSNLNTKIRIGYFSPDFYNHPVSYLMAETFEIHNRSDFEVYGFSLQKCPADEMNSRLKNAFDQFHEVHGLDDLNLINFIRDKQLDIAVDLCGYTQNNRANIFFNRIAPVQISYLGFLGTVGFKNMDYIIADSTLIPEDSQNKFVEKTLYLECYQANDSKRPKPNINLSRSNYGVSDSAFVFCCFNNTYKLNPLIWDAWISILKSSPNNSVLWVYAANQSAADNLRKNFRASGLSSERLIISSNQPREIYLEQFKLCDLFLDTHPYNAGTTASDSLWMGTPVLTYCGDTFSSRVCASLLKSANLEILITKTIKGYIDKAINLANNPDLISDYKRQITFSDFGLIDLFNSKKFINNYESKLKSVVKK
jgi:protein O-GlcNAc transferase